jgi:hypothetical protein
MSQPSIPFTALSDLRSRLPRHSRYTTGVDYVMRWAKAEQLRQEVDFVSEFEALLNEEMRNGCP